MKQQGFALPVFAGHLMGVLGLCLVLLCMDACVPAFANPSIEKNLRAHIAVLASDDFEGRTPGTPGEEKTIAYISKAWAAAGLTPGSKSGTWFDPVSLIQRWPEKSVSKFRAKTRALRFADSEIILIGREPTFNAGSLPVVFAGYGLKNDGSALDDVAGKIVLILFERPDFGPVELGSPRERRNALIEADARGVLFVADNSRGNWSAMRRQLLSRPSSLQSQDNRAEIEGAVSSEFAVGLVTAAGNDWDTLRHMADQSDFTTVDLGIDADFEVITNVRRFNSYNVIGKIAGKKPDAGSVIYMGHWDHLGICQPESDTDRICNGAVDNASGIAVLTEVARALSKKRYDRDIYFVSTTAEESGLLGAYSFVENPPMALDKIVAALNLDTVAIAPRGAKLAIVGRGMTALDPIVDGVGRKLGRRIETSLDSNDFVRRQDGWALMQKDIPTIMAGGSFANTELLQKFLAGPYHGPEDELNDNIQLGGAADDTILHIELGRVFASIKKYPGK